MGNETRRHEVEGSADCNGNRDDPGTWMAPELISFFLDEAPRVGEDGAWCCHWYLLCVNLKVGLEGWQVPVALTGPNRHAGNVVG